MFCLIPLCLFTRPMSEVDFALGLCICFEYINFSFLLENKSDIILIESFKSLDWLHTLNIAFDYLLINYFSLDQWVAPPKPYSLIKLITFVIDPTKPPSLIKLITFVIDPTKPPSLIKLITLVINFC
jgi:hypothetical protein